MWAVHSGAWGGVSSLTYLLSYPPAPPTVPISSCCSESVCEAAVQQTCVINAYICLCPLCYSLLLTEINDRYSSRVTSVTSQTFNLIGWWFPGSRPLDVFISWSHYSPPRPSEEITSTLFAVKKDQIKLEWNRETKDRRAPTLSGDVACIAQQICIITAKRCLECYSDIKMKLIFIEQ